MSNMAIPQEIECKQKFAEDLRYLNRLLQEEVGHNRVKDQDARNFYDKIVPVKKRRKTGPHLR